MLKRTISLTALVLLTVCLLARTAYADSVTLTGGSASTLFGVGTVDLLGNDFVLRYTGEIPPGATTTILMNSVTQSIGLPDVTFAGVTSRFFGGSLAFNDSFLTGGVTAYATMDDMFFSRNPLFIVNFTGSGFLTLTDVGGRTETRFTVATPEPATLFLLGSGLAGAASLRRRRRHRRQKITH